MILQRYLELLQTQEVNRVFKLDVDEPRRVRSRRGLSLLGLAFASNITNITGAKSVHSMSGQATGTPQITGGNAPSADMALSLSRSFTFGTAGANTINQFVQVIFTAVKNSTTQLDLTGALIDFLSGAAATFTVIREIWFEYLTAAQDAVNGSNASATATVTIKFGATNPLTGGPLGADGKIYMKLGEKQVWQNNDATGWAVTAGTGDKIDFVHGVNDYDAKFRITIFGEK